MAYVLVGMRFIADNIRLDPGIYAAEEANRIVRDEGVPFREAYRRVAARFVK
jgi:argininosuccinate lyase